jgi:hypothetical protein
MRGWLLDICRVKDVSSASGFGGGEVEFVEQQSRVSYNVAIFVWFIGKMGMTLAAICRVRGNSFV